MKSDASPLFSFSLLASTTLFCLAASLITRSEPLRSLLLLSILAGNIVNALTTTTHNPVADYYMGAIYVGGVFIAMDYILFTKPQQDLRRVGQKTSLESASFYERFLWGMKRWSSIRSVGWEDQPDVFRAPVPAQTTRGSFIARRLFTTVIDLLIFDACSLYNRRNPALWAAGVSMADRPLVWRYIDLAVWSGTAQAQMRILHGLVSLISVASGISEPQEWVHPFGCWRDAYTLRRFWGRTWHQVIRRCVSTPGKYLARRVLHTNPGSFASSWTQLCTSFALSSVLHVVADFTAMKKWDVGGSLPFYPLQAVGIMFEDVVIYVAQKLGHDGKPGVLTRCLGYAWVWTWFVVLFPSWYDPMARVGFTESGFNMPVSIIMGLWKGDWVP